MNRLSLSATALIMMVLPAASFAVAQTTVGVLAFEEHCATCHGNPKSAVLARRGNWSGIRFPLHMKRPARGINIANWKNWEPRGGPISAIKDQGRWAIGRPD